MIITIKEITEQFDIWNEKAFNGELPTPQFELMQTKRMLGQFCPRKVMGQYTYKIRISVFYDRPFEYYVDTIVHEMLHYYIKYKGIKDTSSHGRVWKSMAANLSYKFGLTITRTNPAGGGVTDAVKEKRGGKQEYVVLTEMRYGKYGAAVVPPAKVSYFKNSFASWNAVSSYRVVKAPWNETYRLRHIKTKTGIGYITKEQYDGLMKHHYILF
jgi:hypothetical protein